MLFDDPHKNFGQSTVDRLLERHKRDQELVGRMLRPCLSIERSLLESEAARLAGFAKSPAMIRISEQAAKLQATAEKYQSSIDRLSSWSRFSAIREASLAIAKKQAVETSNFGKLALSLSEQLSTVTKLGYTHSDLVSKATASWRVNDEIIWGSSLSQFQAIANRAETMSSKFVRLAMEQSAWLGQSTIDPAIVRHVREAQIAMEAMAAGESAEDISTHAVNLLQALGSLFSGFRKNTANEIRDMGLFNFLYAVLAFLAVWELIRPEDLADAERQQISIIQTDVREIRQQLLALLDEGTELEEAFVADLPRGQTLRKSYVRIQPHRQAELAMILSADTPVAIHERRRQWLKVVYRDPLSDQLAMGWIYRSSIAVPSD